MQLANSLLYSEPIKYMLFSSRQKASIFQPYFIMVENVPGFVQDWNPLRMYQFSIKEELQQRASCRYSFFYSSVTLQSWQVRSMIYFFLASYQFGYDLNRDYHSSYFFPLWKNTMIPHDKSFGEISWHILTRCELENMASPDANLLQKGFLTIRNDFTQFVRSWLSRIKRLALEMLEIAIDLEMASGAERSTFRQQQLLTLLVFVLMEVIMHRSLLLLLIPMTLQLKYINFSWDCPICFSISWMNLLISSYVPLLIKQLGSCQSSLKWPKNYLNIPTSFDLAFFVKTSCILFFQHETHSVCSKKFQASQKTYFDRQFYQRNSETNLVSYSSSILFALILFSFGVSTYLLQTYER